MDLIKKERIINLILILDCILIVFSVIGFYNTRPNGYEVSLYTSIPIYIWAMWYGVVISNLIISVYAINIRGLRKKYWYFALLLLSICGMIFTSLPIIRKYTFWGRGDPVSHRQWIDVILSTGHSPEGLIYPISHEWIVETFYLTGISPEVLLLFFNIFLIIPAILSLYLLATVFLTSTSQKNMYVIYLIVMFTSMGVYFFPTTLANKIYPLIVWLFLMCIGGRSNRIPEFTLLLFIMIVLAVPFHPNVVMALMVVFATLGAYAKFSSGVTKKTVLTRDPVTIIALLSITFIFWISQFYLFYHTVAKVIDAIVTETRETALSSLTSNIELAVNYGYSPLEMFLKTYGNSLIIFLYAVVAFFVLLERVKSDKSAYKLLSLCLPIFAFFVITGLMYLVDLGFGPDRMFNYGVGLCVILMVFVFDILSQKSLRILNQTLKIGFLIIIFSLVLMNGLMVMTYYPSPFLLKPNDQFTQSEEDGVMWFTTHTQGAKTVIFMTLGEYMKRNGYVVTHPPYHFNYSNSNYAGTSFSSDQYMILNKLDRLQYVDVLPRMAQYRWYLSDFSRLPLDSSVDRYYTNGETEVWYIHALS